MVKIYVKGNYFFLVKDNIEYEGHRKEVLIKRLTTTSTDFFFKQVNNWNDSEVVSLSDMVDENDVAYTLQTFLDFRKDETGNFNNGGGSGLSGLQIKGAVDFYADLAGLTGVVVNDIWYVRKNQGFFLLGTLKRKGWYLWNGTDWETRELPTELITEQENGAQLHNASNNYYLGNLIWHNGELLRCKADIIPKTFDIADWDKTHTNIDSIPFWVNDTNGGVYVVNTIINYNGVLYKNLTGANLDTTPNIDTINWVELTPSAIELLDADGDTGIEVERTSDDDIVYIKTNGNDIIEIDELGNFTHKKTLAGGTKATFEADLEIEGALEDSTRSFGTSNQILSSTVAGVKWINQITPYTPLWKSDTNGGTYIANTIVNYNGVLYRNTTGTNTDTTPNSDGTNWEKVSDATVTAWKSDTNGGTYATNNLVSYNGIIYTNLTGTNTDTDPSSDFTNWKEIGGGDIIPLWKSDTNGGSYSTNDIINYNGVLYKNTTGTNTDTVPSSDATNWVKYTLVIDIISDADGDTSISVEETPDEDIVHIKVNGDEAVKISNLGARPLMEIFSDILLSECATGGEMSTDGLYTIHTFRSDGVFTPNKNTNVEYLIVAGGGSGGISGPFSPSGGGGGGEVIEGSVNLSDIPYNIVVGDGGVPVFTGVFGTSNATNGGDSSLGGITATGGGAGGSSHVVNTIGGVAAPIYGAGLDGGSGGGGARGAGTTAGGQPTAGQGNAGGGGINPNSGGGGGATAAGADAAGSTPGAGGEGLSSSISGTSQVYGSGGGGAHRSFLTLVPGGTNAGNGGLPGGLGGNGIDGFGGGAGGTGNAGSSIITGANGGSGVVIIRYLTDNVTTVLATNNGNVGIGTDTPTHLLSVNGNASKVGGGSWATFSDERVKENIRSYGKGLAEILKINPIIFNYNAKSGYTGEFLKKDYVGITAQEIAKILPETVTEFDDSNGPSGFADKRQFDSSEILWTVINAIQEQQAQLKAKEKAIEDLKASNEALKIRMVKIEKALGVKE